MAKHGKQTAEVSKELHDTIYKLEDLLQQTFGDDFSFQINGFGQTVARNNIGGVYTAPVGKTFEVEYL